MATTYTYDNTLDFTALTGVFVDISALQTQITAAVTGSPPTLNNILYESTGVSTFTVIVTYAGALTGTKTTLQWGQLTNAINAYVFNTVQEAITTNLNTQNIYNKTHYNAVMTGTGSTTASSATTYFNPASTAFSSSNNYFFNYFNTPASSGSTTGSAYTVYINNAPSNATTPFAFYVAAGKSYLGGAIQIPTGATNGYVLSSDASGNAAWTNPSAISSFADGTVTAPGIYYASQTGTGFYRISAGSSIGVAISGVNHGTFTSSGLNLPTGDTLNVGVSGTTSPANIYGLITGSNGLTITGANSSVTTLSASGLISANAGLTSANGQTVNVGTSGLTSVLNAFGTSNHYSTASFFGAGSTTATAGTFYVAPSVTTALTGASAYFFSYLNAPTTTASSFTGTASTLYIAGAPTVTTGGTGYALNVAGGNTLIGGGLIIPTGATNNYVLTSNGSGVASWAAIPAQTFPDGTSALPGIAFTNQLGTGFYRPASGQIGVELAGANYVLFKTTGTDFVTGSTVNVGTTGTTSPLNVFGLITGSNGLTITGANSSVTTLSASGLISANAGLTSANGQTVNVGTTGTTSILNVRGASNLFSTASFTGTGSTTATASTLYSAPASTAITGASSYFFNYLAAPVTVPTTFTGIASTLYLAGAPTSTTGGTGYAINVASGNSLFGGSVTLSNGNTLNVGTSGVTSSLNVYGPTDLLGPMSTTASSSNVYVAPASTAVTGSNTYFNTYFATPATTGSTTGSAYTVYIQGAPSGTVTTPFSLYVNGGKTYIGATLQYNVSPSNGYLLQSDANGNASWVDPATLTSPTITYYNVTSTTTITTSSTSAVNIAGGTPMTMTPASGTYRIEFKGVGYTSNSNRFFNIQLAKNGTAIAASLSSYNTNSNASTAMITTAIVACNGTDVITVQWYISGGSGTLTLSSERTMFAERLSA